MCVYVSVCVSVYVCMCVCECVSVCVDLLDPLAVLSNALGVQI